VNRLAGILTRASVSPMGNLRIGAIKRAPTPRQIATRTANLARATTTLNLRWLLNEVRRETF
jgi:hypothetical protein